MKDWGETIRRRLSLRRNFKARLFFTLLALSLVPLALAIGFAWQQTARTFTHTIGQHVSSSAVDVMDKVEIQFAERSADLDLIAGHLFLGSTPLQPQEMAPALLEISRHYPVFARIFVTDKTGLITASTEPWENGMWVGDSDYFSSSQKSSTLTMSPPRYDASGRYVLYLARRLESQRPTFQGSELFGEKPNLSPAGIVVGVIDLNQLREAIHLPSLDQNRAEIHIVDPNRTVILSSHPAEAGWKGMSAFPLLKKIKPGGSGYLLGDDPHGNAAIIGYARKGEEETSFRREWVALVSQPKAGALEPVTQLGYKGLIGLLGVAALAFILTLFLTRSISEPLLELSAVARVLARGDFSVRVRRDRVDEFGELASAFNTMARSLEQQRTELQRANEQLEDRNRQLESFVYTISHDLKTPIVSMQGFLALLFKNPDHLPDGKPRFYLDRIRENVGRLEAMIRELLNLSQMGMREEPREWVDMDALAKEVGSELALPLEENGVDYRVQPDLPEIWAVRLRLHQILTNLVENAIKYRSPGPGSRIEIGGEPKDEGYLFYVRDNGLGIALQHRDRIFNIFEQVKNQDNSEAKTGIGGVGLAIVKKAVEMHRGRIWVESEGEGHGSTFFFFLSDDSPLDERQKKISSSAPEPTGNEEDSSSREAVKLGEPS